MMGKWICVSWSAASWLYVLKQTTERGKEDFEDGQTARQRCLKNNRGGGGARRATKARRVLTSRLVPYTILYTLWQQLLKQPSTQRGQARKGSG